MSDDTPSPARTSPPPTRQGPTRRVLLGGTLGALALGASTAGLFAAKAVRAGGPVRNVVLVHGAYADGSCWVDVIGHLQEAGLRATAVQNPLTSLADDVAATARILALQDGPTILVGHSWAGTVISEAGTDPRVAGLVYIAARAPDAGEDYGALAGLFEPPPASAGLVHAGGFAALSEQAFLRDFAGDVDPARARILHAVQGQVADTLFTSRTKAAAWRSKPSWYAVSKNDRTIAPALQRYMAARMSAQTIELDSSHLSPVSRAREVAALIVQGDLGRDLTGPAMPRTLLESRFAAATTARRRLRRLLVVVASLALALSLGYLAWHEHQAHQLRVTAMAAPASPPWHPLWAEAPLAAGLPAHS